MSEEMYATLTREYSFFLQLCKHPSEVFSPCSTEYDLSKAWLDKICTFRCKTLMERRIRNIYLAHLTAALNQQCLYGPLAQPPKDLAELNINDFDDQIVIDDEEKIEIEEIHSSKPIQYTDSGNVVKQSKSQGGLFLTTRDGPHQTKVRESLAAITTKKEGVRAVPDSRDSYSENRNYNFVTTRSQGQIREEPESRKRFVERRYEQRNRYESLAANTTKKDGVRAVPDSRENYSENRNYNFVTTRSQGQIREGPESRQRIVERRYEHGDEYDRGHAAGMASNEFDRNDRHIKWQNPERQPSHLVVKSKEHCRPFIVCPKPACRPNIACGPKGKPYVEVRDPIIPNEQPVASSMFTAPTAPTEPQQNKFSTYPEGIICVDRNKSSCLNPKRSDNTATSSICHICKKANCLHKKSQPSSPCAAQSTTVNAPNSGVEAPCGEDSELSLLYQPQGSQDAIIQSTLSQCSTEYYPHENQVYSQTGCAHCGNRNIMRQRYFQNSMADFTYQNQNRHLESVHSQASLDDCCHQNEPHSMRHRHFQPSTVKFDHQTSSRYMPQPQQQLQRQSSLDDSYYRSWPKPCNSEQSLNSNCIENTGRNQQQTHASPSPRPLASPQYKKTDCEEEPMDYQRHPREEWRSCQQQPNTREMERETLLREYDSRRYRTQAEINLKKHEQQTRQQQYKFEKFRQEAAEENRKQRAAMQSRSTENQSQNQNQSQSGPKRSDGGSAYISHTAARRPVHQQFPFCQFNRTMPAMSTNQQKSNVASKLKISNNYNSFDELKSGPCARTRPSYFLPTLKSFAIDTERTLTPNRKTLRLPTKIAVNSQANECTAPRETPTQRTFDCVSVATADKFLPHPIVRSPSCSDLDLTKMHSLRNPFCNFVMTDFDLRMALLEKTTDSSLYAETDFDKNGILRKVASSYHGLRTNDERFDIDRLLDAISAELKGDTTLGANNYLEVELSRYRQFLMRFDKMDHKLNNKYCGPIQRAFLLVSLQKDLIRLMSDLESEASREKLSTYNK